MKSFSFSLILGILLSACLQNSKEGNNSKSYLTGIQLSSGGLMPSFSPEMTSYTSSVPYATDSLSVTTKVAREGTKVKVNGETVESESASAEISLSVGENTITIEVTAQDEETQKTYTVKVTRAASANADLSDLVLSEGSLTPSFSWETTSYKSSVSNATNSLKVAPTEDSEGTTIKVNGETVESDSESDDIPLSVGKNIITIEVTAQDKENKKTYTVTVTRVDSTNADLFALVLSEGDLNPSFSSDTTSYTSSVPNASNSLTVTATETGEGTTIKVNGETVESDSTSSEIALSVGENTITIEVMAQDKETQKTYTVTVTRAANANADLSQVVLSEGSLTPSFSSDMTNYTSSVSNATTSLTVTPTAAGEGATIKVDGDTVESDSAFSAIALSVGANIITMEVTAQDEQTQKTYMVTVTRAASANANLSDLMLSEGSLTPSFSSDTTSYTSSVSIASASLTVTPTAEGEGATIKVNGDTVELDSASSDIELSEGENTITIEVTAQDKETKKTYTVTVSLDSLDYNGWWKGKTDQNSTVTFTVQDNKISHLGFFFTIIGLVCTVEDGKIQISYGKIPLTISGSSFYDSSKSGNIPYMIYGYFTSDSSCSGTIDVSYDQCKGSISTSWTASKK